MSAASFQALLGGSPGFDPHTYMLLHCDGSNGGTTFTDSSSYNRSITVTNATTSTTQVKFGTTAGSFNGSTTYLKVPDSTDFDFGTGDWTVDLWAFASSDAGRILCFGNDGGSCSLQLRFGIPNLDMQVQNDAGTSNGSSAYSYGGTGAWFHVAAVRSGTNFLLFIGGVLKETVALSGSFSNWGTNGLTFGAKPAYSSYLSGYLDEIRLSNNARWTSGFTPPTSAYAN